MERICRIFSVKQTDLIREQEAYVSGIPKQDLGCWVEYKKNPVYFKIKRTVVVFTIIWSDNPPGIHRDLLVWGGL